MHSRDQLEMRCAGLKHCSRQAPLSQDHGRLPMHAGLCSVLAPRCRLLQVPAPSHASPNTFALIRATNKKDTKNTHKWVHDRNKSTTQTHEEPRRVHTRKRACECKCAADGPPTPSGVRTQANSLHESRLGTGGTARVRVCVEKCLWKGKRQMSRNIVVMWDFLFVFVTIICTCPDTASMKNLSREKQLRRSRLRQGTALAPKRHASL